MMKKFCSMVLRRMPRMTAKVMVVVAMMMQARFLRNTGVCSRLGISLNTIWLSSTATMT